MKKSVLLSSFLLTVMAAVLWLPGSNAGVALAEQEAGAVNPAVVPVSRPDQWWVDRQEGVLKQIKEHPDTQLIFLGDSITHGWDGVGDLWNFYFGAWQPINMGFSGDRTEHVLWRLDHGSLEGIHPKVAVIMIGTNNSNPDDYTAEQIAEGVTAVVNDVREKLPETKILLLAIFPRSEQPDALRENNMKANQIISKLNDGEHVFYLDINQNFLNPDQSLSKDIMPDFLHPNRVGYQIWAISIKDKLAELEK